MILKVFSNLNDSVIIYSMVVLHACFRSDAVKGIEKSKEYALPVVQYNMFK